MYGVITCLKNLFDAWKEFKSGKIKKGDVSAFAVDLEENLFNLHHILKTENYVHGNYTPFFVHDPKLRSIHKAKVIDRVLHHAIVRVIEPIFDRIFIYDSYSSRKDKGTHKAGKRFREFAWKLSQNNTKTVWVLKCDIKKFFDSVDHEVLVNLIKSKIGDESVLRLLTIIIHSFNGDKTGKGIPLGNLTSQLFSNIYLDPFDQFVKRKLRLKYYIRYADDFAVFSRDEEFLKGLIPILADFLSRELKLTLHPKKIVLQKWHEGVDFLGFVHFPRHSILRTKTKRRILGKMSIAQKQLKCGLVNEKTYDTILQSYLGRLKHCRSRRLSKMIEI